MWQCHQLLSNGKWSLASIVTSVANDKNDNEVIPGNVHRYSDIHLTAEENLS